MPLYDQLHTLRIKSSLFSPPVCYQTFIGRELFTTTGSSATFTCSPVPCRQTCPRLASFCRVKASLVKQTILSGNTSVITYNLVQILGVPTFCKVAQIVCQNRFTRVMFPRLASPSFRPCRCQQRPWLCIVFPLVRRLGFL